MSAQAMRALIDRAESDEAFRERIAALSTPEEKYQAIREAGFDIDQSDIPTAKALTGYELSDEDLEQVAGGGSATSVSVGASIGGSVGAAAVVAVVAAICA